MSSSTACSLRPGATSPASSIASNRARAFVCAASSAARRPLSSKRAVPARLLPEKSAIIAADRQSAKLQPGDDMQYRKLGSSDLNVSEISLGSWLTYGVGVERDAASRCVDRAFELGINFIDTAN